ncbi:hypothetical protein [Atopobacter phocae]|uniref:hypothetical protein n=1 Tax=Atopobacter phocae TaxID=136492 RepID=UPI0004726A90|nr:hypothetical protein [Atopobacter phocae]
MAFFKFNTNPQSLNDILLQISTEGAHSSRKTARPIRSMFSKKQWRGIFLLTILFIALAYYITLPPLNWQSSQFWRFFISSGAILGVEGILYSVQDNGPTQQATLLRTRMTRLVQVIVIIVALLSLVRFGASPIFNAKAYSRLIEPLASDFSKDVDEVNLDRIPIIDHDTASRLGNRKLGTITDLVSQFEPSPSYTQINVNDQPVRVTPLRYAGFFKWMANQQTGIPNYLTVNMSNGDVKLETPDSPIKYSESEYFNRNIMRYLRFNYPTKIFQAPNFEIDEDGVPYYVATTYKMNFLLTSPEPSGAILVNAIDGTHRYYHLKDVPQWVDRIVSSKIVIDQLNQHGLYKNGFWNTLFAKRGATRTTEGYNYIVLDDDVWLYTGITSVTSDESNIGFVLTNMRTKETRQYTVAAAEEYSAMSSARGAVQEKNYKSTFPILINKDGRPTYIMSLKDKAGLVKMYAMVDAEDYQDVATGTSLKEVIANYGSLQKADQANTAEGRETKELTATIDDIKSVVVDGNTMYYLLLDDEVYFAKSNVNERLPFMKAGTRITIESTNKREIKTLTINE